MSSTFFGLSVATSGLNAQQQAMDVISYNIANANDPTYKRQRVVMTENSASAQSPDASAVDSSPSGSGASAGDIQRVLDQLVDTQVQQSTQTSAEWSYKSQTMQQIQSILGEPSDTGLENSLDTFFNDWQNVANTPSDTSLRTTLLDDASSLCQQFQYTSQQLQSTSDSLNSSVEAGVNQVNQDADQIAQLNGEINSVQPNQFGSNDLENQRDALVLDLSNQIGITQSTDPNGDVTISIGGRVLVQGAQAYHLETQTDASGNQAIQWAGDGQAVTLTGGQLKGITDIRDTSIPSYMSQLNAIAGDLVSQVNAISVKGTDLNGNTGNNFFTPGTTASNISLDSSVAGNPAAVPASGDGEVGSSSNAQAISALGSADISQGLTFDDMYQGLVSSIAGDTSTANSQSTAQQLTLTQFTSQQQSVSGVSLDEEMTNMVQFQQAYNASSRVITVMNDMLTSLMDMVGES